MKTIVALVDYSDATFKVLKQVHALAQAFHAEVVLMHVVPLEPVVVDFVVSPTVLSTPSDEAVQADQQRLQELQESLAKHGVKVSSRQFQGVDLDAILEECKKLETDLIVVGTHGHGALYNLLIGSMTADILKKAFCPVLVVPA